ncbi:hypothetical protein [Desulfofundulus kuznetsovii]
MCFPEFKNNGGGGFWLGPLLAIAYFSGQPFAEQDLRPEGG